MWNKPWARGNNTSRISTIPLQGMKDLVVNDLMIKGEKRWDEERLL